MLIVEVIDLIEFIDKSENVNGTPLNREKMMAIQGFVGNEIKFNSDGSIEETNQYGEKKITKFNNDGSVEETFVGEKTITKTTYFNSDGGISEVIQ